MSVSSDYEQRFGGVGRLFGRSGLERLAAAHVCVVGVGGVGSWAVEALARSGLGALTLIDLDDVCLTNVNRQLPALDGQIGRPKVEVLAERVQAINPGCQVTTHAEFFTKANAGELLATPFSYCIDAIDKVNHKALLLAECHARRLPALAIGGAGGKRDSTGIRLADLGASGSDRLLRQLRRRLREEHGFPGGNGVHFGIPCVFSAEAPVYPWANGEACATPEPGSSLALDCASGFGTAVFATAAFGLAAAGAVVRHLAAPTGV